MIYRIVFLIFILSNSINTNAAEFTYTENDSTGNNIALGFPVPIPVDSLTPIDGFRTYSSLNLRHQQLVAQSALFQQLNIGATINNRPIFAYQLSDSNNLTNTGAIEASALINGGIHAREWQSPEALTGYMEAFFNNADNQHIEQYILENLNLVLIPVLNIDGFLQTQRFASKVTQSEQQPRDGRMRRKNMRDVDENLSTESNNLLGIDLNRNNNPYWNTNPQRSSSNANSLVYHGTSAASEPETQALQQAATLADSTRLRFYTDTHSFTQIYFTPMTGNQRRDAITANLATVMRTANNFKYRYGPSAAGSGIGATDEYFANTYQIPSYTLEIEPLDSAVYGFGVSHAGFILPNSEVARMRQETTKATLSGLYNMTELPIVTSIKIVNPSDNNTLIEQEWQANNGTRELVRQTTNDLIANTEYQLTITFNKPMRQLNGNQVTNFGQLSNAVGINLSWLIRTESGDTTTDISTSSGTWLTQGFKQYKTDSFQVNFTLPADFNWQTTSLLSLQVDATDMTGQKLDTNPATISDWQQGHWINYENVDGQDNDQGGLDKSMRLIDDGSDLYASPTPTPPPAPTPPAPTPTPPPAPAPAPENNSGGGSIFWLGLYLFALLGYRKQ